jgi:hypothetical protein
MEDIIKKIKGLKQSRDSYKELYQYYKELSDVGMTELKFKNLQVDFLYNLLDEIESVTDSELIKSIIENGKNRYELDKIIHAKKIFNL